MGVTSQGETIIPVGRDGQPLHNAIVWLDNRARAEAQQMAEHNSRMLAANSFDYLVCICPTCATTIKKEWPKLLRDEKPEVQEKAEALAKKVMDINDFLVNVLDMKPPELGGEAKMTYHDPCHLAKGLGIREEPRQLLRGIPGIEYTEMEEADSCCGFGGSFSLYFYDLSRQINVEKIKHIEATGAECVVTSCPGCMIHIADGIDHTRGKENVIHIVQLLAQAIKAQQKQ